MNDCRGLRLCRLAGAAVAGASALTFATAIAEEPSFLGVPILAAGAGAADTAQPSPEDAMWLSLAFAIDDFRGGLLDAPPEQKGVAGPLTPEQEIAALRAEVAALQAQLAEAERQKESLTYRLSMWTMTDIVAAEDVVARTGLDTDLLLLRLAESELALAKGGTYIPVSAPIDAGVDDASLQALGSHVDRWDGLRQLLLRLPLAEPMDEFRSTSSFGIRVDPINGRHAFHAGQDFAGPMGMTIRSTAPGVVVHAGFKGGYGRMIEVDHGLGVHTRYAHLSAILVEVGDEVDYRAAIGRLGSSGRSTGPHLHYEIRFDGEAIDPAPFIDAGRYVFKAQAQ